MTVGEPSGRTGVESAERVAALRATRLLETGPEEAFDRLTRLAATVLGTPMVFLTVVDDVRMFLKGAPDPGAMCGPEGTLEVPAREASCQVVIDSGHEVVADDVRLEPRLCDVPQVQTYNVAAWVGVPVTDPQGRVLGNLCAFDTRVRHWSEVELETMRTLAGAASGEVALRLALAETERYAAEAADLARTLQESLVPPHPPRIPGVEIASRFRPGGSGIEVLGDFYDVVPIEGRDDDRGGGRERGPAGFGVVVGDVCGHGAAAARTTAMARSAVRTAAHTTTDPGEVLRTVDEVLGVWFGPRSSFVTAVYATFHRRHERADGDDHARGWSVTVAGAGHPPAMVRRGDGTVEQLAGGGRVLGTGADTWIAEQSLELGEGESLVFYTDGITEARDPAGRQLDESGLAAALAAAPLGAPAAQLADIAVAAAETHAGTPRDPLTGAGREHADDAAVLVIAALASTAAPRRSPRDLAPH